MKKIIIKHGLIIASLTGVLISCNKINMSVREVHPDTPPSYHRNGTTEKDTTNMADISWKKYFSDPYLVALIDSALANNQELNILLQQIQIEQNEIQAKKGEYLPSVGIGVGAGVDKSARYTRFGALEKNIEIEPGKEFPEPLPDFSAGLYANWEIDVWKKLRNARKAAIHRYLASVEGRNFMITNLVTEISDEYYELLALDKQLRIVKQNIEIQSNALKVIQQQKQAAKVTELAVLRFEAQLNNTKSLQYEIEQRIIETENSVNFLVGRFPQKVERDTNGLDNTHFGPMLTGLPSQLLQNRTDIRQAELELTARKLDVQVVRAKFYPSIGLSAGVGLQAFKPGYLIQAPESILYGLAADLMAPLVNRKALKTEYANANNQQMKTVLEYEMKVLMAYIEVSNQVALIDNLQQSFDYKKLEVDALTKSIQISGGLFKSARADYMEVLLTQRDAIESKFELVETQKNQILAHINLYKALGGGWK